jgi:DJ-1 family protein
VIVYIVLGNGFEEIEAIAPGDILRRGGVIVKYLGVDGLSQRGGHNITVEADAGIEALTDITAEDLVVIPGGLGGVESIEGSKKAMELLAFARDNGARFAAICAGPRVLAKLGILKGKNITCYPGNEGDMEGAAADLDKNVVQDGDLITGRAPGAAYDFGLKLLESVKGAAAANEVRAQMYYDV